ncbi:hypothetical protein [Halopelagius longus]|uniref:Uncharacterized protein n=1 Tax=Halopelagius longus TaxID=1236180 RepID=A0A1H1EYB9_9EURY|nr:hypothetical protein [Halopelagius longus]RDI71922.1 hypothetical protein DWB78_09415 [Halopelagius longus]SDQ93146.1 hypothetical protein SAMN05216278_3101 [Halopelagius longus]
MVHWSSPQTARQHPSLTFGVAGGTFAVLFVAVATAQRIASGEGYLPSGPEVLLVLGGFVGGALLARVLWTRLGGTESPLRGAVVGALVGLFAMPVPMYLLEFALVVVDGMPFEAVPGMSPWMQVGSDLLLLLATPLLLAAFGLVATYGGTVVVGAATGYLLARR